MMTRDHKTHAATAVTAITRKLVIVCLAGSLIALASIEVARADDAVPVAGTSEGESSAQRASVSPTAKSRNEAPAAEISREYLIKAAILFNFAKFASWPDASFGHSEAPLRICVLGDDPFGAALDSLTGKRVRHHRLETKRIANVESAPQCHILFVSASEEPKLQSIIGYVSKLPILTVADMGRFASSGGIIALKEVDNRSRIEINLGAAEQAGLRLSSKLLRLADTVTTQAAHRPAR